MFGFKDVKNMDKQALEKRLSKKLKKLEKKEQELLENVRQCSRWPLLQHEGDLIKFHFASIKKGTSALTLYDWETDQPYPLTLDPTRTIEEEMIARFKQAKKLKRGERPLVEYLGKVQRELSDLRQQQEAIRPLNTEEEWAIFKATLAPLPSSSRTLPKKASPSPIYREYPSAQGMQIWVGKTAKANDRLTFQLANGSDWWLHARGCPGSHVIIRLKKEKEPDPETLKDALQLALYYSKARAQGEGEIYLTQCKYVSSLKKGKQGAVQISKHQTAWIRFEPARWEALKKRKKSGTVQI